MIPVKPKDVMWSDEQWLAIHASGTNILVSAGAGSGKTAVLSERIIEKLKKGVKLSSLIVLTFTKAAACEMKERIRKRIIKAISEGYSNLKSELEYIDQANIQTFDAFSLALVRKYHYKLNLPRHLNIGDKVILTNAKKVIIDEIMDEYYQQPTEEFTNFMLTFALKDDTHIKSLILSICDRLELISGRNKYLKIYLDKYYDEKFIQTKIQAYVRLCQEYQEKIRIRILRLERMISDDILVEHIDSLKGFLAPVFEAKTYRDFLACRELGNFPSTPRKGDEDEKKILSSQKDLLKKDFNNLQKLLIFELDEEFITEINHTKEHVMLLLEIIEKYFARYDAFKHKHHLYEFYDIAKMGIDLLKSDEKLREEIKNNTHEILIDEYQDTSDIQEEFINLIANNNVYMVGDIKQSIYRFRNANPNLFKDKYIRYSKNEGGLLINLYNNYRSRKEVIDSINLIFSKIMSEELGAVTYDKDQRLRFGNKKYLENIVNSSYNMEILSYQVPDSKGSFKRQEVEAFIIANDIKNKIVSGYQVLDENGPRLASFRDFTILTRTKSNFELYKKIFEYLQIPLAIHKEDPFVLSDEIFVIKNILICIQAFRNNNFDDQFKLSLMSVLRSFILRIDDKIISKIIGKENIISNLKQELPDIYQKFVELSKLSKETTIGNLVLEIYQSFSFYEKIILLGNVDLLEDKLLYLASKARELSKIGYGLDELIEYFNWIIEEGLDIEFNRYVSSDADVVNMMSIHKSKGLEFPVCYYADLSTRFNLQEIKDRFIFHVDYGILVPIANELLVDTFYKDLLEHQYKLEEIGEQIRLLYVALTRAKEQIVLVTPELVNDTFELGSLVPYTDRVEYRTFYDILESINYALNPFIKPIDSEKLKLTKEYLQEKGLNFNRLITEAKKITYLDISMNRQIIKTKRASQKTNELLSLEQQRNIELGNTFHQYLELIDFTRPNDYDIMLIDDNHIKEKLNDFFNNPFIKNLKVIKTYHEYEFSYQEEDEKIRGIIDLIIETNDELIIIDYKLYHLDNINYESQLKVYKNYLSKISSKTVSAYLYSIMKNEFKKIF